MDNIKTLTDINLFADTLNYRLKEIPANVRITLNLCNSDYEELNKKINLLPQIYKQDFVFKLDDGTGIQYTYEGIIFIIKRKLIWNKPEIQD